MDFFFVQEVQRMSLIGFQRVKSRKMSERSVLFQSQGKHKVKFHKED